MTMTSRYSNLFFFIFFKVRYIIEWTFHVMHRDVYNNNYILCYDSRIALPFLVQRRSPPPIHPTQTLLVLKNTSNYVHRYPSVEARTFENVISPRWTKHTHTHEHAHARVP